MGLFQKLMKRMVEYYAREAGGIGWRWQAIGFQELSRSCGRSKNRQEPYR
jgi:hypothetical protein